MLGALVAALALLSLLVAPPVGRGIDHARPRPGSTALLKQIKVARGQQARLQAQLDVMAGKLSKVQDQMAQTQFAMLQAQREIQQAESGIAAQQSALDQRARMAYESGAGSTLEIVLGSTSASDLNERLAILDAAAQSDKDVINQLTDQTNALHTVQKQLLQQRAALLTQQADLQSQQDALSATFQKQADLVKSVAKKVKQAQKLIKRLKSASQIPGYPGGGRRTGDPRRPVHLPGARAARVLGRLRRAAPRPHPRGHRHHVAVRGRRSSRRSPAASCRAGTRAAATTSTCTAPGATCSTRTSRGTARPGTCRPEP